MKLRGKVALVTGASRGIGKSIAYELAKEGANVIVNYNFSQDKAKEVVDIIKREGFTAEALQCDVSSFSSVNSMIEKVISKYGKVDILVNNAGVSQVGLFCDTKEEDYNQIIDINFKGMYNTCRNIVNHMIWRKEGVIINISSIWGSVGASCEVLYSASKGAVNSFTKALGKELGPSNIRVNAVSPGVIETEMNNWLTEEEKNQLIEEIPMSRLGKAEEVGKLVAYLCSDDAAYINSQVITIDGGMI